MVKFPYIGRVKKTSFYKFQDRTNWALIKFCPPNNVSTYFRASSEEDVGLRPRLSEMGYVSLRRSRKARLDDALRRMMASCPAPKRLRVLAEELAALSAAEILKPAWPMQDKL